MFRPGLGQESPQGTPGPPFPGLPRSVMPNPNQFGPPFVMHGRGSPPGPPPGHPQHFPGQYPGYPGPQRGAGPPAPYPGNAPIDHMPPSPQVSGLGAQRRVLEEAPLAPRDIEMLKNIDILSGFVVKNGPQFEDMARQKQANDPKFGFLFGGEPGTEAALGKAYYEWRKRCLLATTDSLIQPRSENAFADASSPIHESPLSPNGSDMDMEDDFEEPSQVAETKSEQAKELTSNLHTKSEIPLPPRMETNMRPQGAQNPRVPTPQSVSYQGNSATGSQAPPQAPPQVAVPGRTHSDTALDELPKRKDARRRTGFDRPCMEDVTPVPSPPRQGVPPVPLEQDASPAAGQGQRSRGSSRVSRWGPQDQSLPQHSSRRATSSVDVSTAPMKNFETDPERELEAVTPQRDDDSEHEKEGAKDFQSKDTATKSEDKKSTDYPTRLDRDQPKDSPVRSENRKTRDSDSRRNRDSPSRLGDSRTRDGSPRVSKHLKGVSEPDLGNKAPTVDEFGRIVRPGGSDSDAEDSQYDRRRKSGSASRSRSRSPANSRRRRRSRSRSPRRHNRSRSRSPRRRRSWSKSPPARDSRRGGDGVRGWERGHQDRSERGGRRSGRGDRGGAPPACRDFAGGRCKRGNACRFAHSETTNGSTGEGRYERGGDRGGRASRQDDRQESHDGGRSHGGGSRSGWSEEAPRARRGWEPNDEKEKDYSKEPRKSFEELAREQPETSPVSDYGDDFGSKPSEIRDREDSDKFHQESKVIVSQEPGHLAVGTASLSSTQAPYSEDLGNLPNLSQLPPPPPPLSHSQGFPSSSFPLQQPSFNMGYPPSQSGFSMNLPPPPPPPPMNQSHHLSMTDQPPYVSSGLQQPGLPHSQVGGQSVASISRSGYTWQSTPTATPASMAYSVQPVQASGAQSSYPFLPPPPPPLTAYASALPQYQLSQQTQAGQSGGQFNMMSDRPEPGPPGAGEAGSRAGQNSASDVSRHSVGHWKGSGGNGTSMHMDDVILESVSPGLPGHHHMENVSPGPGPGLVMESVSPAIVTHASNTSVLPQQGIGVAQQDNPSVADLENVSPAPERPQSWSPGGGGESNKGDKRTDKRSKRDKDYKSDKEDHKIKGLTLLRTAVAEHVKDTLKPTWREGQMSKEAFKTIAKKAVDKVLSAIKPHQVPNTEEKVAAYMVNSRPKIAKLVQGYVDKYVKA